MPKGRVALSALGALCLFRAIQAQARPVTSEWVIPAGWHIDRSVKRAVAAGDLTGTGVRTRAVLLTNDREIRLTVVVGYGAKNYRAYNAFEEPVGDLQSQEGIKVVSWHQIELEPGSVDCASKWIYCAPDRHVFFQPPMPSLWLAMGEWGGSVFKWIDFSKGFERFSVGD